MPPARRRGGRRWRVRKKKKKLKRILTMTIAGATRALQAIQVQAAANDSGWEFQSVRSGLDTAQVWKRDVSHCCAAFKCLPGPRELARELLTSRSQASLLECCCCCCCFIFPSYAVHNSPEENGCPFPLRHHCLAVKRQATSKKIQERRHIISPCPFAFVVFVHQLCLCTKRCVVYLFIYHFPLPRLA